MKAIQIRSQGGPEVLKLANLPEPARGADQVLVRIKASAVNPLDGIVRAGDFPIAAKPPLILGEEASGIVERDGAGFNAGEKVIVYGGGLGVFREPAERSAKDFDEVVELAAQRKYHAVMDKTFPATEAVAATRHLE